METPTCVATCLYFAHFISPERCLKMGRWVREDRRWNFHRRCQWSSRKSVPEWQCFFPSILTSNVTFGSFLFCASEEQKWEETCLLFVSLLVGEIYFPFIFLLTDFFFCECTGCHFVWLIFCSVGRTLRFIETLHPFGIVTPRSVCMWWIRFPDLFPVSSVGSFNIKPL